MFRENYIDSLRVELVEMVADRLTPVALRYGYSEVPLEANIKWRPQVLVLGNYSSGKSTLINELVGGNIQTTGQAPTDDSFTIITYDESDTPGETRVIEERDGKVLLNDPEYPFEILKKHGQRFSSHFRLKKVNSPFLKHLALIDTPGMLDSVSERDRGYDYQEVIGDLALIADLVLVLFDPHKAGTVREAHASLRDTLPKKTFEDRVLFVLNRVDECSSLNDLLRVYGTLCWNLSQITGRKDIPMIRLTYSKDAAQEGSRVKGIDDRSYLQHLENQRDDLKTAILQAPKHRLDHLASYVETHSERIGHFLEGILSYKRKRRGHFWRQGLVGLIVALGVGAAAAIAGSVSGFYMLDDALRASGTFGAVSALALVLWLTMVRTWAVSRFHQRMMNHLDELTPLPTQTRRDSWTAVKPLVHVFLKRSVGVFGAADVKREYAEVMKVHDKGGKEIRQALRELGTIRHESIPDKIDPSSKL